MNTTGYKWSQSSKHREIISKSEHIFRSAQDQNKDTGNILGKKTNIFLEEKLKKKSEMFK